MTTWKKVVLGLLLILIVAGIYFYPKYKMLNHAIHLFDEDKIVDNFRTFDEDMEQGGQSCTFLLFWTSNISDSLIRLCELCILCYFTTQKTLNIFIILHECLWKCVKNMCANISLTIGL